MRGRKPKPSAIRALHNSDTRADRRERRDARANPQPQPEVVEHRSVPDAPTTLDRAERRYWTQFASLLAGARVLTPADVESLADYCRACVAVDDRSRRLRKALSARGGFDQSLVRLLDAQMRGWVEKKTKLASELGLTAISRTRINWTGYPQLPKKDEGTPAAPKSKLAELQDRAAELRRPVGVK